MNLGRTIREFFRGLFGSRTAELLETELLNLRQDFQERMRYQDDIINNLREEKAMYLAKITIYESTLMPLSSRAGAEIVKTARPTKPNFPNFDFNSLPAIKTKWQAAQEEHDKEIEAEIAAEAKAAQAPQGTA